MTEAARGGRFRCTARVLSFPLHPRLSFVTLIRIRVEERVCKYIYHLNNVRVNHILEVEYHHLDIPRTSRICHSR